MIEYRRLEPTQAELERLLELSAQWVAEDNCRGYRTNTEEDLKGRTFYAAIEDGIIVGYLFGLIERSERASTVIEADTPYFEVEELYVLPYLRSRGVGRALFRLMEQDAKRSVSVIMLSTATKNARAILHFYLDEVGMDFWSARLFKYL